jgi:hypothetical protein
MFKVHVRALQPKGRWRCGKHWPAEGREDTVSAEELERLVADPVLSVKVLEELEDAPAGTPLPEGFPHKERLEAAGFVTLEAVKAAGSTRFYPKGFKKPEVEEIQLAVLQHTAKE